MGYSLPVVGISGHRSRLAILLAIGAVAAICPRQAVAQTREPAFPATPAGRAVAAYFRAFNSGEAAMRDFYERFAAKEALRKAPLPARLERYRQTRARVGRLEPQEILESRPDFIAVSVRAQEGQLFQLNFSFEPQEPHGLVEVLAIEQKASQSAFFFRSMRLQSVPANSISRSSPQSRARSLMISR